MSFTFNKLLAKDGFVSIYHQDIRQHAIEKFIVFNGLNPEIITGFFQCRAEVP